jgi:hypothetical protein
MKPRPRSEQLGGRLVRRSPRIVLRRFPVASMGRHDG